MTGLAVGVVDGEKSDPALVEEIADVVGRDAELEPGAADAVLDRDSDAVIAIGESALLELVRAGVSVPVLPIAAGPEGPPRCERGTE